MLATCCRLQSRRYFYCMSDFQLLKAMLDGYRKSTKKPTQVMKNGELIVVEKILKPEAGSFSQAQVNTIASFLTNLRVSRFLNVESLNLIDAWVSENWQRFSQINKINITCFLVEQGRPRIMLDTIFKKTPTEIRLRRNIFNKMSLVEHIITVYCNCIVEESLHPIVLSNLQEKDVLSIRDSIPQWKYEMEMFCKALGAIKLEEGIAKYAKTTNKEKSVIRSVLEIETEALLKAEGLEYERQFNVLGLNPDFIVSKKSKPTEGQSTFLQSIKSSKELVEMSTRKEDICFLEVMGWHHFTVENKIFGKDLFRAMILDKVFPVGMIHFTDFNRIKGVQNRLAYLRAIVENTKWKRRTFEQKGWIPSGEEGPSPTKKVIT